MPALPPVGATTQAMKRAADAPEADALRRELAEVIRAILQAPDEAERADLVKRRNAIGKQLAHLLKSEQVC